MNSSSTPISQIQTQQQYNKRPNISAAIDVLIVGAGPTGLVMASELARHGVKCRIIGKSPTQSQASKALDLQSRTLDLFDLMDIDEFLALETKIYAVNMYASGERFMRLTFDELNGPYPFDLDLPQSETERILEKHLERFGLHIERQVELVKFEQTSDSVNSTLLHHSSSNNGDDSNNNQEELVRSSCLLVVMEHIVQLGIFLNSFPDIYVASFLYWC